MKKETIKQVILTADTGKVLTNGETYATTVVLPASADITIWQEITEEEYNAITANESGAQ